MDFKLTRQIPRDIDIIYDAVNYVSGLAEEVLDEVIGKEDEANLAIVSHLMDLSNELRQAATCAQLAFWEKGRLYGKN